jgi:hypothetical protein
MDAREKMLDCRDDLGLSVHPAALSRTAPPYPGSPSSAVTSASPAATVEPARHEPHARRATVACCGSAGGPCPGGTRRCRGCTISLSGYPVMPTVGLTPGGGRSYPSPPRLSRCPLPGGGCHVPTVPVLSRGRQGRWARDDGTFVLCPGHRHHVTHARVARQRRRAIPATGAGGGSRPLARSVRVGLAGDLPQVPAVLAVKEPRLLAAQPPTSSGRAEPPPDDVLTARVPGSREQLRRAEPDGPLRQPRSAGLIHANWPWCLRPPAWSHGVSEAPAD